MVSFVVAKWLGSTYATWLELYIWYAEGIITYPVYAYITYVITTSVMQKVLLLLRPNPVTISSMLHVLGELGLFKVGMKVHGYSLRMGIESDIFIGNSVIDMYSKSRSSRVASTIFNKIGDRNIVISHYDTFNSST